MSPYDQFILFGDSITQQSSAQDKGFGFSPALQDAYIRRLDVVNRGFSGYNTSQALKVLERIIPDPEEAKVRFLTIFFGANDARLPNEDQSPQYVSPEQYKQNLIQIIRNPRIVVQNPRIILVTPPPVDEYLMEINDRAKGICAIRRTAANTKYYAEIVKDVGRELEIPVLDIWTALMKDAGWNHDAPLTGSRQLPKMDALEELLHDGIHFNPKAYNVLYMELMELIRQRWPDQMPENLPLVFPAWDDASAWGYA
ncbi:MAG: hypothetical protein M1820_004722 [Bogoriella megaspora]|nr:MAG: hypothetical protein M1820_004722 [Bogoriella megaspora]